jgi:hypothetical protein
MLSLIAIARSFAILASRASFDSMPRIELGNVTLRRDHLANNFAFDTPSRRGRLDVTSLAAFERGVPVVTAQAPGEHNDEAGARSRRELRRETARQRRSREAPRPRTRRRARRPPVCSIFARCRPNVARTPSSSIRRARRPATAATRSATRIWVTRGCSRATGAAQRGRAHGDPDRDPTRRVRDHRDRGVDLSRPLGKVRRDRRAPR